MGYHPNIQQIYYTTKIFNSKTYPLAENIDIVTLRDWIYDGEGYLYEDYPQVSTRKILNVLIQIACGLHHMHSKGLAHHCLRP